MKLTDTTLGLIFGCFFAAAIIWLLVTAAS